MSLSNCFVLSVVSGVLFAAPFLFPELFPLTWISLIPLFHAIQITQTSRRAFLVGWSAGLIVNISGFYWLFYTIRIFGGYNIPFSLFIFLFLAIYSGLALAFFSFVVKIYGFGPLCLFPAVFWTAIEFWFPNLFPWHLANSQSSFLTFIQTADLVGPYGTSFLLVWFNTLCYQILRYIYFAEVQLGVLARNAAILASVLMLVVIYGHLRLSAVSKEIADAPILKLAAVQGNIDVNMKGNMDWMENKLNTYKELTLAIQEAQLVIWPESAIEFSLPESLPQLPLKLRPKLPSGEAFFVFGGRSFRGNPSSINAEFFNSALLTDSDGRILALYHKQVLLMFGEYIPFFSVLSRTQLTPENSGVFTAGTGPTTLDLPNGMKLAPLICYEDLMPELAREFVAKKGATLLINLTNDAWFGNTAAPWQHARLAQWRSIETRRTLVRATNTGLTSVINPRGEIIATLPTFKADVLTSTIPLMEGKTIYVRFGDWFAWLITCVSIATVVLSSTFPAGMRAVFLLYSD